MSDLEKKAPLSMTEEQKEGVEQRRTDFKRGFIRGVKSFVAWDGADSLAEAEAKREFPDPPKPREIRAPNNGLYRALDGKLQTRLSDGTWSDNTMFKADIVRALHDLLERPNE